MSTTTRTLLALSLLAAGPLAAQDSASVRPHAIQHSDFYYFRLKTHKIGSYAMFPIEGAEYVLGNDLLNSSNPSRGIRDAHGVVAGVIAGLFGANTLTGAWNLWDSRHDSEGRTRRYIHSGLLIAADAGFVWSGASAHNAHQSLSGARTHRNIALGSIGLSAVGTVMMWLWN